MDGCIPFKSTPKQEHRSQKSLIIGVRRGTCTYVMKTRHAQEAGAHLVVFFDNVASDDLETTIIKDDGTGSDIHIPSIMIGKKEGDMIVAYKEAHPDKAITALQHFDLHKKKKVVEMGLWTSSSDREGKAFLVDFAKYANRLGDHFVVKPKYLHWQCHGCSENIINNACVSSGLYCGMLLTPNLSGRQVVLEDLRQKCILKESGQKPWWLYVSLREQKCKENMDEGCSESIQILAGVEADKIDKCLKDTFIGSDTTSDNTLLMEDMDKENNAILLPQIDINGFIYKGDLNATDVFRTICDSYQEKPIACIEDDITPLTERIINVSILLIALGVVVLLNICVICLLFRRRSAGFLLALNSETRKQVQSYMQIKDKSGREALADGPISDGPISDISEEKKPSPETKDKNGGQETEDLEQAEL